MTTVIKDRHTVKARKRYHCDWCGAEINPGDKYTSSTLVEDSIYTWRECGRCEPYIGQFYENCVYSDEDATTDEFTDFMYEKHRDIAEQWWG